MKTSIVVVLTKTERWKKENNRPETESVNHCNFMFSQVHICDIYLMCVH